MLRLLKLENFRAFEKASVELTPLTVLLGANSTGKSSILHALILLKQSLQGGDHKVPLTFDGPLINLGWFQQVAWQQEWRVSFHLEWDDGQGIEFPVEYHWRVDLAETVNEAFRFQSKGKWYTLQSQDVVDPWYFSFRFFRSSFEPQRLPEMEVKIRALDAVNKTVVDFFSHLRYIGPLRRPARETPFSGERPESVGPDARYLIPFLKSRPDTTERIGDWLRERGLAYAFEIQETTLGSGRWAAYIVEKEGRRINLTDTGFGYSQLLPVLAEIYGAPDESLILVEQPELHLNPRLAVWMGDVLLTAAQEGKAVLVETHSEHILLRLRRRVAEGALSADDLALYFSSRSLEDGNSHLQRINLDELGQPTEKWPDGFWGEDYDEAFRLAEATLKRQRTSGS